MLETQEPKYQAVEFDADGLAIPINTAHHGHTIRLVNRASGEQIPDDEPIFIFRARDVHAIEALTHYQLQCQDEEHRGVVEARLLDFRRFKHEQPDRMKEPDSQPIYPWPRA